MRAELRELKREEGCRLDAYQDSLGVWTIGYGRNLQVLKITQEQADDWLLQDYQQAVSEAARIPEYATLSENRQRVLRQMVFQMGRSGVMRFKNFRASLQAGDYKKAASHGLQSKWAHQTPGRAKRLMKRLKEDSWPTRTSHI